MSIIAKPSTFAAGQIIIASEHNADFDTIYNDYNGNITNENLSATAAIADTKLAQITTAGKVSGAALTSLASIPAGAGLIPAANLPATTTSPTNYRAGMRVAQASSTTLTIQPGVLDVSGNLESAVVTTLTLTTAANWAGGVSLQATSTFGYVGVDSSGNMKLHTTAPTHSNYAVSVTLGTKRYATWSGTVYRIIGWFYMNSTGSGELNSYEVNNFKEMGVSNVSYISDTTADVVNDTSYGSDLTNTTIHFYTTGGDVDIEFGCKFTASGNINVSTILDDGADITASERTVTPSGGDPFSVSNSYTTVYTQGTKTFSVQMKVNSGSATLVNKFTRVREN